MRGPERPRQTLARQALDVVSGRWVPDVVAALAAASPMRYGALLDAIPDIPEGSLSRTLRQMERDGLVRRTVGTTSIPIQVDYQLTDLGASIIELLEVLAGWESLHGDEVQAARAAHHSSRE